MQESKLRTVRESLKKQKKMICFSVQFVDAVNRGNICPELFESDLAFPDSNNQEGCYRVAFDWKDKSKAFKETAEDASVYTL